MLSLRNPSIDQCKIESKTELKVQINNDLTFYLNSFPKSYQNLEKMIQKKISSGRRRTLQNLKISYYDEDKERISIGDDTDLGILSNRLIHDKKTRFKIHAEFDQNSGKNILEENHECLQKSKILKFCDFLNEENSGFEPKFKKAIQSGKVPCMECLGKGKDSSNNKCENCYGFGERPKDKKWNLIFKIIEYKFNELLLVPFQKLCNGFGNSEKEELESDYDQSEEETTEESGDEEMLSQSTLFKEVTRAREQKQDMSASTNFYSSQNNNRTLHGSNSTILPRSKRLSNNGSILSSNTQTNPISRLSRQGWRKIRLDEVCSNSKELSNVTKVEQCINILKDYMPKDRFKEDSRHSFESMRTSSFRMSHNEKAQSHHNTYTSSKKINLVRLVSAELRNQIKPPRNINNLKKSKKLISKKLIKFSCQNIDQEIILRKLEPEINLEIKNIDDFSWPRFTEVKLCDQNFESVVSKEIPHEVAPGQRIWCNLKFKDLSKVSSTMLLLLKWKNEDNDLCYQSQWAKLRIKKV